jgi:hypothetical protein
MVISLRSSCPVDALDTVVAPDKNDIEMVTW